MTTVAAVQMSVADLDVERNRREVRARIDDLDPDVELAVFPEYALTGFVADDRARAVALDADGPELRELSALAEEREVAIAVGFLERADDPGAADGEQMTLHNALAYLPADGAATIYRKRHLWGEERSVLSRGERLVTVETPIGTAGLLTCYDLNFVADSAAFTDRGVDALLVAGAWPAAHGRNWRLLLRARALDGVRWAVGACRTGTRAIEDAPQTVYAGQSAIVRPDGVVAAALARERRTLTRRLDPELLAQQRETIPIHDHRREQS